MIDLLHRPEGFRVIKSHLDDHLIQSKKHTQTEDRLLKLENQLKQHCEQAEKEHRDEIEEAGSRVEILKKSADATLFIDEASYFHSPSLIKDKPQTTVRL